MVRGQGTCIDSGFRGQKLPLKMALVFASLYSSTYGILVPVLWVWLACRASRGLPLLPASASCTPAKGDQCKLASSCIERYEEIMSFAWDLIVVV